MLLKERAYKKGQFTLSSGKESEHYVNCKPVTLSCEGNALLSLLMIEEIEKEAPDQSRIQDEIGDIFFVATNIARLAGCEPETSLILSNRKFEKRFRQMEKETRKNNQSIEALNLDELETLWEKAKKVVG